MPYCVSFYEVLYQANEYMPISLDTVIHHYRALIGGLNHLSCCTRPGITYIVNQLARYKNAPTKAHWNVAIGVLMNLRNTSIWGISLGHGYAIDSV